MFFANFRREQVASPLPLCPNLTCTSWRISLTLLFGQGRPKTVESELDQRRSSTVATLATPPHRHRTRTSTSTPPSFSTRPPAPRRRHLLPREPPEQRNHPRPSRRHRPVLLRRPSSDMVRSMPPNPSDLESTATIRSFKPNRYGSLPTVRSGSRGPDQI